MLRPEDPFLAPVRSLSLGKDFSPLLRVGIEVFLELQELLLVDSEHRELIAHVGSGQVFLGELDWAVAYASDCLG